MGVGKENVPRLHIAVDQPDAVCCAKPLGHLNPDFQHLSLRNPPLQRHQIVERPFIHQLHRNIIDALVAPKRKNLDHKRMRYRSREFRLGFELRNVFGVFAEFLAHEFERNNSVQIQVARFVDRPHAARGKELQQLEMVKLGANPHRRVARRAVDFGKRLDRGNIKQGSATWTSVNERFCFGGHGGVPGR